MSLKATILLNACLLVINSRHITSDKTSQSLITFIYSQISNVFDRHSE